MTFDLFVTPHRSGAAPDSEQRDVLAAIMGADFSALSITPSRADTAPIAVRKAFGRFADWDSWHRVDLSPWCVLDHGDAGAIREPWGPARESISRLAARAADSAPFTVAIGGDHSVTWPLATTFAERCSRLGIIQFDAHHDVRPIEGGVSNGTPIRGLIEEGVVKGRDVVQIGIHPFANHRDNTRWAEQHGIVRYSLDDVVERGMRTLVGDASMHLADCDALHITVDIDVLDRAFAPGTVAAMPGGLSPSSLAIGVFQACSDRRARSLDVVEFDPSRDVSDITAYNVAMVVFLALSSVAHRTRPE